MAAVLHLHRLTTETSVTKSGIGAVKVQSSGIRGRIFHYGRNGFSMPAGRIFDDGRLRHDNAGFGIGAVKMPGMVFGRGHWWGGFLRGPRPKVIRCLGWR